MAWESQNSPRALRNCFPNRIAQHGPSVFKVRSPGLEKLQYKHHQAANRSPVIEDCFLWLARFPPPPVLRGRSHRHRVIVLLLPASPWIRVVKKLIYIEYLLIYFMVMHAVIHVCSGTYMYILTCADIHTYIRTNLRTYMNACMHTVYTVHTFIQ